MSFALGLWQGHHGLDASRFPDEVYARESIEAIVRTGSLRPISGFHPILSYLPQGAVLIAVHGAAEHLGAPGAVFRNDRFTPLAYQIGRAVQALFFAASVLATAAIGRRLGGFRVGAIAAVLVATAPWMIRQAGLINEDMMLVFFSLVAFLWSVEAGLAPGRRAFVAAGAAIGLALMTKFNAAPIALPLIAAAALLAWRARCEGGNARAALRPLAWLALAGVVALALFLAGDPYVILDPDLYRRDFGRTLGQYERWSQGTTRLDTLGLAATTLGSSTYLGWAGWLALAGAAVTAWRLRPASRATDAERMGGAMLLAFLVGYPVLYALATKNPSAHNFLQVVPFAAIAAALLLERGSRLLETRFRRQGFATPALLPVAALAAVQIGPALAFVYRETVRETVNFVELELADRLAGLDGRIVVAEGARPRLENLRDRAATVAAESLAALPEGSLDAADAEVFPSARLSGEDASFYRARLARATAGTASAEPARFVARGPALTAVAHPWRPLGRARALPLSPRGSTLVTRLPVPPQGALATFEIRLRRAKVRAPVPTPRLVLAGRPIPLLWVRSTKTLVRYATARLPLPAAPSGSSSSPQIEIGRATPGRIVFGVRFWGSPWAAAPKATGSTAQAGTAKRSRTAP